MKTSEYNEFLNNLSAPLLRYAFNFLKNQDEAKDIVQDVFEKLWLNRDKVDVDKVKAWLFRCAYHAMINYTRKQTRMCKFSSEVHDRSNDERFEFESKQVIDQIVSSLPPIQKSIILLRDLEGYHYSEIGEILSLNPSQVKVYLFRARLKIKKQLIQLKEVL